MRKELSKVSAGDTKKDQLALDLLDKSVWVFPVVAVLSASVSCWLLESGWSPAIPVGFALNLLVACLMFLYMLRAPVSQPRERLN